MPHYDMWSDSYPHQWGACRPAISAGKKQGNHFPLLFRRLHTAGNRENARTLPEYDRVSNPQDVKTSAKGNGGAFAWGIRPFYPMKRLSGRTNGEPEAADEVLRHYSKRIQIAAIENGHIDRDTEDSIKSRLVAALFKFRFDEQPYRKTE